MSSLGKKLKTARIKKGLTQDDAAKRLGITFQALSNYERGVRDPDTTTLKELAKVYNTSADYLLGNTDIPAPPQMVNMDDYILQSKDLGEAILRIFDLQRELGFDDNTLVELMKKARDKYGLPRAKYTEPAAHGPGYPGSGAIEDTEND